MQGMLLADFTVHLFQAKKHLIPFPNSWIKESVAKYDRKTKTKSGKKSGKFYFRTS